jgi:NADPH-dependent glutamate synthase beta subunit-like oxidoreductase/Pyruvate/2-oxoacid:ferredoxin oxidoreductase delta subunit
MLDAVFMMGGLGLLVGAGLAVASKVFYVYVDPKILAVEEALPGANCGGCGLPGCSANAEAIVAGRAAPNSCVAAGADVAQAIAAILGVSVEAKEPDIARPGCTYGVAAADTKYLYDGMYDCRAAALLSGGMKVCTVGCLGLGTCARTCPFHAISMGPDGLPVVDERLCTGCGTCERVCPKHIITLSSVTRRILREYTTDECTTPCQRACPAGIDICRYIHRISQGDYKGAVQVIKERNPFPTVIGRICPRPCENECRRRYVDEPVAINFLKRFAADYEMKAGERVQPFKAPETGRKVAVIGGGVEGLSTAFFLARLGHSPTVYEGGGALGGLLRSAIARNRLPSEILDWDIQGVLDIGVKAETQVSLGRNLSIESLLRQGNQVVFAALGGWDSRLARGEVLLAKPPLPGMHLMLDFIRRFRQKAETEKMTGSAVVYGGGPLAVEAAKACRAAGAAVIKVFFREPAAESPLSEADLRAFEADHITVRFNTGIDRFFGESEQLTEVETVDLVNGTRERVAAGTLVLGAGRFPDLMFFKVEEAPASESPGETASSVQAESTTIAWTAVSPYKEPAFHTEKGLFSDGDAFTDYSAAIKAIGAGRRAAASIHEVMYGISLDLPGNVLTPSKYVQNVDHVENVKTAARRIMPLCDASDAVRCHEIEQGFDEHTARFEAGRCLQCGLICYRQVAQPSEPEAVPALT